VLTTKGAGQLAPIVYEGRSVLIRVYFIRHNLGSGNNQEIFDSESVAIDYGGQQMDSVDPKDYNSPGNNKIALFNGIAQNGGIIAGRFSGVVKKGSTEPFNGLMVGTVVLAKSAEGVTLTSGAKFKRIRLTKVRFLPFKEHPLLVAMQPRAGTFAAWHLGAKAIRAFYFGYPLPCSFWSLSPAQVEVLCYEYLQLTSSISSLLLPIGRTLECVDIWGIGSDGVDVVAQVTFGASTESKSELLEQNFPSTARRFLFAPRKYLKSLKARSVTAVSLEDVFSHLLTAGRHSVLRMLPSCQLPPVSGAYNPGDRLIEVEHSLSLIHI